MNIEKELQNKKESAYNKQEDVVKEVKLLLEGKTQQDLQTMRHLAPNSVAITNERKLGLNLEIEKLDEEYGKVFHIDQIREIAIEYRLRFLRSKHFRGNLDVVAISKLNEFAKETNTNLDTHTLGSKFYILAPPEQFILKDFYKVIDKDPVLFYKIDDLHYRMIHKWGKDFTVFRRILGFKWKNSFNKRLVHQALLFPIVMTLMAIASNSMFAYEYPKWLIFISLIINFAISRLTNTTTATGEPFKHDDDYFTPHNWNSTENLKGYT